MAPHNIGLDADKQSRVGRDAEPCGKRCLNRADRDLMRARPPCGLIMYRLRSVEVSFWRLTIAYFNGFCSPEGAAAPPRPLRAPADGLGYY